MSELWQSLVRAVTGKPDVSPEVAIPASAEQAIKTLREARFAADQETRLLRDINRRMDPAAALRLARQRREEAR